MTTTCQGYAELHAENERLRAELAAAKAETKQWRNSVYRNLTVGELVDRAMAAEGNASRTRAAAIEVINACSPWLFYGISVYISHADHKVIKDALDNLRAALAADAPEPKGDTP